MLDLTKSTFVAASIASIAFMISNAAVSQDSTTHMQGEFLQRAVEAANWIESQQIKVDAATTWPSSPSQSGAVAFNLYSGNAGVVIFFLELHQATGDAKYLEFAQRGARALLAEVKNLTPKSDPGYWTGYTGIAATLAEVYRATEQEAFLKGYEECTKLLKENARAFPGTQNGPVQFNSVTDIIGGSAGIGFFLLYADQMMKDKEALPLAIRLADRLVALGESVAINGDKTGLKWMMTPEFPREMPNYSHGTAGICDFLLSLDARLIKKSETQTVTNYDGRFANAAVAGANYLTSIAEDGSCQILHHKNLAPDAANEDPLFYLGWCHGPAGTGRLFLNLSERFPLQKEWRHFAEQGGELLMSSGIPNAQLPGFWNNVGVCCGSSGVGSYVLELYKATGNPKLKEFAIRLAMDTVERGKKHELSGNVLGLSWTHAEHRVRPEFVHAQTGVMQGAAGIGLWFLKLHATLNDQDFDLGMPLHPLD